MKKKLIWLVVSIIMIFSLAFAGCSGSTPATTSNVPTTTVKTSTPTTSTPTVTEKPQYGGSMAIYLTTEPIFNYIRLGTSRPSLLSHEYIQSGNWAKGPAGGYGTNEISWADTMGTYIPSLNQGFAAESLNWQVDPDDKTVTSTIEVRKGVHYAVYPGKEASNIVNGREMTADDVLFCLNNWNNNPDSAAYQMFPDDRGVEVVKTGPWELSLTLDYDKFMGTSLRTFGLVLIYPPEIWEKYGLKAAYPENCIGTGPFIITDYVSGSMVSLVRNDNYWMNDPVGPGKGNQLPYIDSFKYYVITDQSTQDAAIRTAKVDQAEAIIPERSDEILNTESRLVKTEGGSFNVFPLWMRVDVAPFDNLKVRRALMMATDFNTINDNLYDGLGQIVSWPSYKAPGYEDIYLGLDDPECPDSVKELYTYNPEKAKELLAEAGYPNGFEIDLTLTSDNSDYYSIIQEMWSRVDVKLKLSLIEANTLMSVAQSRKYHAIALFYAPTCTWPEQTAYTNPSNFSDGSMVDDPYVNEMANKARRQAITDFNGAMLVTKELMKYVLEQAYVVPTPRYPQYSVWWPWIKNYTGENRVGYMPHNDWVRYVWIDQSLKKSMGF